MEVEQVVMEIRKGKSPRLDGFTTKFFQACWEILGEEIWTLVEISKRVASIHSKLDAIFIVLVLKDKKGESPASFRPFALCNVIYKIVSKVIANRLKPTLLKIISYEQMGFVEGTQILDNIILAHELIHNLKIIKNLGMLIKLDLAKAFD